MAPALCRGYFLHGGLHQRVSDHGEGAAGSFPPVLPALFRAPTSRGRGNCPAPLAPAAMMR